MWISSNDTWCVWQDHCHVLYSIESLYVYLHNSFLEASSKMKMNRLHGLWVSPNLSDTVSLWLVEGKGILSSVFILVSYCYPAFPPNFVFEYYRYSHKFWLIIINLFNFTNSEGSSWAAYCRLSLLNKL